MSSVPRTLTLMGMPWSPMQSLTNMGDELWMHDRSYRVAIIRQVHIGKPRQPYWRSVTGHEDRTKRQLIGYFPTLEFAAYTTWHTWEQHTRLPVEDRHV